MSANEDFLAYAAQEETEWVFVVPIRSESVAGLYTETLTLIENCYDVFGSFVSPTKVEFLIGAVDADLSVAQLADYAVPDHPTIRTTLSSRDGISWGMLESAVCGLDDSLLPYKHMLLLKFIRPEVTVTLADGVHTIGKNSPSFKQRDGTDKVRDPPLDVEVQTFCNGDTPRHTVTVSLNTDIWFEDTELGEANRQRLREFLERMADTLDATEVEYWSETRSVPFDDLHDR